MSVCCAPIARCPPLPPPPLLSRLTLLHQPARPLRVPPELDGPGVGAAAQRGQQAGHWMERRRRRGRVLCCGRLACVRVRVRVSRTRAVCVCVCRREEDGSREESEFFSSAHSSLRAALPPAPPSPGAPSAPSCRPGNHHTLLCTAVHTPGRAAPALHPPPRLHPPLSPMSDHRVRRAQCRRAGPTLVHPDPRQQGGRPRVGAGSLWFWGAASLRCRSPPSPPLPPRPPSSPTHSRPGVMVTTSGTTAGATR